MSITADMSKPKWPKLTFDIPEDSPGHARCLQKDFDVVDQFLKLDRTKQAPRYLFNILYRSYSELHAKLQAVTGNDPDSISGSSLTDNDHDHENDASISGTVLGTNKCQLPGQPPVTINDKGGQPHLSVQKPIGGKASAEQIDVQRVALGSTASAAQDEDLRDERLLDSDNAGTMQAQITARHGEGPDIIVPSEIIGHTLGVDLRHSVVTRMRDSTFYVILELNSDAIHNKSFRDQLVQYYAGLKYSDRCLAVYDALNADPDIIKNYVHEVCVCDTEVTSKGNLAVFVRSSDRLPPLVAARHWRKALVLQAFNIISVNYHSLAKSPTGCYNSAECLTDSLRIIGRSSKTFQKVQESVELPAPPDIVVQVPRANAKDYLNHLRPVGVVQIVQKAFDVNPGYDKDWVLGATVGAGGNINIQLTNRQIMKTLLLDKSWQVNLRRRLALGRQTYRVQLLGIVPSCKDFKSKRGRSRVARTLVNNNYSGNLERRDIRSVDWYSQNLTTQLGSIVVTFTRAGAANLALEGGLRWQSRLHQCMRLPDDEFVEQCYKCQAYEYYEAECLGDLHCANCAMDHCSLDCEETFRKCMLCGGGHASTDPVCPLRATREAEAKQRIELEAPFGSMGIARHNQPPTPEKQDAAPSLPRDSGLGPVPINPNPTPSCDTRVNVKEGTSSNGNRHSSSKPVEQSTLKRTASEPLGHISGNVLSTPSAKRVKKEDTEKDIGPREDLVEDPIQKYNRENGAMQWPPPKDQPTMGAKAKVSRTKRLRMKKQASRAAQKQRKRGKQGS